MTLPHDWQAQIDEGQRLRGWVVNSFAQVEYLIGDLILRCCAFTEYEEHTRTLPHGAADRIRKTTAMLTSPGPLDPDADDIRAVLEQLAARQDIRNLLVHGFCTIVHTPAGELGFHFQKFHRHPDRQDARLIRTFTLEQLHNERDGQAVFATAALQLFAGIHDRFGWIGPVAADFRGDEPFGGGNSARTSRSAPIRASAPAQQVTKPRHFRRPQPVLERVGVSAGCALVRPVVRLHNRRSRLQLGACGPG